MLRPSHVSIPVCVPLHDHAGGARCDIVANRNERQTIDARLPHLPLDAEGRERTS
jgi:hypothetical protein